MRIMCGPRCNRCITVSAIRAGRKYFMHIIISFKNRHDNSSDNLSSIIGFLIIISTCSIFIIAIPPCQAGMVAKLLHCKNCLFLQLCAKPLFIAWIGGTCHEKILYNQNPQSVTFLIEYVFFKHSAAPDSQHIQTCSACQLKQSLYFFSIPSKPDRITGYPVCALTHNRYLIYKDYKTKKFCIFFKVLYIL